MDRKGEAEAEGIMLLGKVRVCVVRMRVLVFVRTCACVPARVCMGKVCGYDRCLHVCVFVFVY